jgi:hypothetical protein
LAPVIWDEKCQKGKRKRRDMWKKKFVRGNWEVKRYDKCKQWENKSKKSVNLAYIPYILQEGGRRGVIFIDGGEWRLDQNVDPWAVLFCSQISMSLQLIKVNGFRVANYINQHQK